MAAAPSAAASGAAVAESAATGAAKGVGWVLGKFWSCLNISCGIFTRQIKKLPVPVVSLLLRVLNIANAVLLGFAGYFAFTILNGSITRAFLSTYIVIFAALLFLFEVSEDGRLFV